LPKSQNRRTLGTVDEAAIVLLVIHLLLPTSARWHLTVPIVARDSLEVSVEKMEAHVDRMSHDDGLRTWGHHHTCPFLSEFAPSATR
jgi:hypothetical protein